MSGWTFNRKIGLGFTALVLLTVTLGALAVTALRGVVEAKDRVIGVNAHALVLTERLNATLERKVAQSRGFLLSREPRFLDEVRSARSDFEELARRMDTTFTTEQGRQLLNQVRRAQAAHDAALEGVIELRRGNAPLDQVERRFQEEMVPRRDVLAQALSTLLEFEERMLDRARQAATDISDRAARQLLAGAALAALFAAATALLLTRTLSSQLGSAVQNVHSSSAELQAAANQQAAGARQQATAMTEIGSTVGELLVTSRQIAASCRRVVQVAEETGGASQKGDGSVGRTQELVSGIRRQVDVIVAQMLDLGRKSQQIAGVLDVINELAEQTNILAINASIEAAGAGEAGRRFSVVADEIRKLADRVGGSSKEIRGLVDEVRTAVNTTVMATESGSKAVDAGNLQVGELARAFRHIASLVETTTEATREIELSTRQQATAVEQVRTAVISVAQATREAEASSAQTLQTAAQLTGLSRDLDRLFRSAPRASARA